MEIGERIAIKNVPNIQSLLLPKSEVHISAYFGFLFSVTLTGRSRSDGSHSLKDLKLADLTDVTLASEDTDEDDENNMKSRVLHDFNFSKK